MPPLILLHGFDSSGLEYRRLGPKLAQAGVDTYAVDVLGWGYTQIDEPGQSFSAQSKIEALQSFVQTLLTNIKADKFCVAGASLGGAAAIELAYASKDSCAGLVLIDAQGFVDGVGPMALLPKPLAQAGVAVLKSVPLRNSANQMSYYDVDTYATEEAQMIGRLHCLRSGWSDAMVNFMQSGGFKPSTKVPQIVSPALVLWGRQDGILDGNEYANKFIETLPDAELTWIEECGHVPHLEQPEKTCDAIVDFLSSAKVKAAVDGSYKSPLVQPKSNTKTTTTTTTTTASDDGDESTARPSPYIVGGGFLGAFLLEEVIKTFF
jgi:pimeloyl-ACP methyl ester carboxylesterase